jgi:alkyl hydroperoxide reductase subunit AhpC
MKFSAWFISSICALVAGVAVAAPVIGKDAPAFTATDSNGKAVSLADFKGKVVVLEWTNNGCPFVKKHYASGNMPQLQQRYTQQGVVWLSVISSAEGKQGFVSGEEANKIAKDASAVPTHILLDGKGELGHLYDAKTTPHMYIVDKNGKLVYQGAIDSIPSVDVADLAKATAYVANALDTVLAGGKVAVAETKAYGCSVKY